MQASRAASGIRAAGLVVGLAFSLLSAVADNPSLDVDALAARMPKSQDLYKKTCAEALKVYAARNPAPTADDAQIKELIRLWVYLEIWDDFYGEDLWSRAVRDAEGAKLQGAHDPLLDSFLDEKDVQRFAPATDADALRSNQHADTFLATAYPPLLRLAVAQSTLHNLAGYIQKHAPDPTLPSVQGRGRFVQAWGAAYRELIRMKLPHDWLFDEGDNAQHLVQSDEPALDLLIAEQERCFNEADPANPVRTELDGNFDVTDAWNARGNGYANSVTNEGAQLFEERLAKAAAIMEPFWNLHPDEVGTCRVMMKVELGQGEGRERMETWFKRAIAIDPNRFIAYKDKAWYLQPQWHGSVEDEKQFGEECVKTQNWAAKVPLILPLALGEATKGDRDFYKQPEIWAEIEAVYRGYLSHYPDATLHRTVFLRRAFDSGHLDVAREQFKILGDRWDRSILSNSGHAAMAEALGL